MKFGLPSFSAITLRQYHYRCQSIKENYGIATVLHRYPVFENGLTRAIPHKKPYKLEKVNPSVRLYINVKNILSDDFCYP